MWLFFLVWEQGAMAAAICYPFWTKHPEFCDFCIFACNLFIASLVSKTALWFACGALPGSMPHLFYNLKNETSTQCWAYYQHLSVAVSQVCLLSHTQCHPMDIITCYTLYVLTALTTLVSKHSSSERYEKCHHSAVKLHLSSENYHQIVLLTTCWANIRMFHGGNMISGLCYGGEALAGSPTQLSSSQPPYCTRALNQQTDLSGPPTPLHQSLASSKLHEGQGPWVTLAWHGNQSQPQHLTRAVQGCSSVWWVEHAPMLC